MSRLFILLGCIFLSIQFTKEATAQSASSVLGNCIVNASTGRDRVSFARWIGFGIMAHPAIRPEVAISERSIQEANKEAANIVSRLLLDECPNEARAAFREDEKSIEEAFEVMGRVAMEELMRSPDVESALVAYANYLDIEKFEIFFGN